MKTKIFSSILGLLIVSALALNYGCVKESTDTVPSPVYKSSWHVVPSVITKKLAF